MLYQLSYRNLVALEGGKFWYIAVDLGRVLVDTCVLLGFERFRFPNDFFATFPIPMLFARWRSQDLIFLTPYTAAPGFKPTSDSRAAPDWDLRRTLYRLSYSAAAGFQKNKFKNEPDSRRTGGSTFGRPRSRRCCPSTARLHFLPDKKMRSFGGWETGRWTGPRNLNSISPINMSPVLTKIPQVSPIPYRVLFCLTLLKEVALIIQLNASSIGFTGSGWWCRWLQ